MSLIGNVIWIVFGGLFMAIGWYIIGAIAFLTIVGIPWGRACFVIGGFALWPFGRDAVSRDVLYGQQDLGTGVMGMLGNIIWFVMAGLWLVIGHVLSAAACAITIIGIPFAWQHLKLASLALWPIGKTIVAIDVADAARRAHANKAAWNLRRD